MGERRGGGWHRTHLLRLRSGGSFIYLCNICAVLPGRRLLVGSDLRARKESGRETERRAVPRLAPRRGPRVLAIDGPARVFCELDWIGLEEGGAEEGRWWRRCVRRRKSHPENGGREGRWRTAQTPAVGRMIASRRITFTFSSPPRLASPCRGVVSHPRDHDFIRS